MNKKRLSVVMAGAMLATSVAPVLAAETTTGKEIAFDNLASFKADVLAEMAKKENKVSDFEIFKKAGFVSPEIATEISNNATKNTFSSKLGVKITGKDGKEKLPITYIASEVKDGLDALETGDKVEIYSRETSTFAGQILPGKGLEAISDPVAYNADPKVTDPFTSEVATSAAGKITNELAVHNGSSNYNTTDYLSKIVSTTGISKDGELLKVVTNKTTTDTGSETVELKIKLTDNRLDGKLAYDANNQLLDVTKDSSVQSFDHFGELVKWQPCAEQPNKGAELKDTYTIGEKTVDETKETLKVSDLFDGIALTEKGTSIVADLANAKDAFDKEGTTDEKELVYLKNASDFDKVSGDKNGVYKFEIKYFKNGVDAKKEQNPEKVITVISNNYEEIKGFYRILETNEFNVGVVAGQNRYETAVNVAKQQNVDVAANKNIVLVNGDSLVDGLAAAPLAAEKKAPLLLTEANKLSKATKEYIEEEIDGLTTSDKRNVTVSLVGGRTVLTDSLVKELEEMGLTVKRVGGENREATSLAVAKELPETTKAFVVGANGEADAMSISAVAADKDKGADSKVTPIIVSKVGGLSTEVIDHFRKVKADDITIVGGTSVVSEKEEEKINDSLTGVKVIRLAGKNRIETNNAIIEKYYSNSTAVVSVKDGMDNRKDLVDALSAANYAAGMKAPIVLASKKVTDTQKSTILKSTGTVTKVVQVGLGAERTVLETIANLLGVTNKVK